MSKGFVTSIFYLFTLLALLIIYMSMGWFLIVFIIVLPPAMILHYFAWYKSINKYPASYGWIILSSFIFLIFSLLRLDKDDHGVFNSYQAVAYQLGIHDYMHAEPLLYSLELSFVLLLSVILLDAIILRKTYRKVKN